MTAPPPRAVPLLGPDVVLLAMEGLGGTVASGNAVLVLELATAIDPDRVRRALARFLPVCPWLGGRLRRPWPWGMLQWHVPASGPTPPAVRVTAVARGELAAFVDRELAAPLDPYHETPLRVTLADEAGVTCLVVTWAHPLMDPHGAEHLVRLLAEIDERPEPSLISAPLLIAPRETRPLRERASLANRGAAHLKTLAPLAPISLAAARAGSPTGRRRHRRLRCTAVDGGSAGAAMDRTRRGMPWRLAVVAKAMTALYARRGLSTAVPFLVPVSVDRRARGEHGPVLGNYLGFHFARCDPPIDGDTAALARVLRDQLADAVRRDEIEAGWAGMSFARYRPLRGMFRELPWAAAGDFCSFHFADTDALLPDRTHLFGAPLAGGYHVAAVPTRPGVGVFFSRRGPTETVVVSWADDALDDADVATLADVVQHEMGWESATE